MAKASQFLRLVDQNGNLVEGECFADKHAKEVELTGWHWDVEDPAVPKSGPKSKGDEVAKTKTATKVQGDGEGESERDPKPSKFSFSKTTDRSTTRLLAAMDRGEIFPVAVLTIEEQYEESPLPFELHVELTDAFIVDFKWSASADSAGMTFNEEWELNYSYIEFKYHWRGGQAGWIDQKFKRPPDSKVGTSQKSPLTAAEKKAAADETIKQYLKKAGKK